MLQTAKLPPLAISGQNMVYSIFSPSRLFLPQKWSDKGLAGSFRLDERNMEMNAITMLGNGSGRTIGGGPRHRDNAGLDIRDKALRSAFPAIFNKRRSTSVSEEYQFYNSEQIITLMQDAGLRLVEVAQERLGWSTRRQPHTQIHVMRFMSPTIALRDFGVGDSRPEVVIMNSHDGRCTFRAMAGVFRLVCSNGMIVGDTQLGAVVRRHYGEANAFDKVREILSDMPKVVDQVSRRIADWSALDLDEKAQLALARLLMKERNAPDWLEPAQVIEARRPMEAVRSDGQRDLWTTFNVAQEALTNSTIHRLEGEGRARAIQPVNASIGNVKLNSALWTTADAYFDERVSGLRGKAKSAFEERRGERVSQSGTVKRKLVLEAA